MLATLIQQVRQTRLDKRWQDLTIRQLALAEASIKQEQQVLAYGWSGLRKFKVESKNLECEDVYSFQLIPHDRQPIPSYKPGQHLTLIIHPHNQKKIVRCYSLSDCYRTGSHYVISVKRLRGKDTAPDGKGSGILHREINEGDLIDIKAPKGGFFLNQKSEQPVVLLANGVGITPLLAMLNYLYKEQPNRLVSLYYGVQNGQQLIQGKHLKKIEESHPNFLLNLAYSRPLKNDMPGRDFHCKGYVNSKLVLNSISKVNSYLELEAHQQFEFYICGSAPMMEEMIEGLRAWKVPEKMINYEAFGAASIQKPAPTLTTGKKVARVKPQNYTIELRQSGKILNWDSEQTSLLEFCQNASVPIDCGCCCGECGTCEIAIISGSITYPNRKPETEVQDGHCLLCIAAPTSSLVIDA